MRQPKRHRESGMALLVTLVLIALTALLAFSGSEAMRLQQRLSSNDLASQIAFQAAEAALREAIVEIDSETPHLTGFCNSKSHGYLIDMEDLENDDVFERLEEGKQVDDFRLGDGAGIAMKRQPRYSIACIEKPDNATPPSSYYFRIYAQGFGPGGKISRVIEARYVPDL